MRLTEDKALLGSNLSTVRSSEHEAVKTTAWLSLHRVL